MTEPLYIALDLDDVVLDFTPGVLETVNRDFGTTFVPEDVNHWDTGWDSVSEAIGRDWFEWLADHAWLWGEKFKPVPGALGGIEKLRAAGHYVEIVTSKPAWAEDALWTWVARYKPRVHRLTIVPLGDVEKHVVTDADVLVDDRWDTCKSWSENGRPAILYNRPHNHENGMPPDGVVRAHNWRHILSIFQNNWIEWPQEGGKLERPEMGWTVP